MPAARPADEDRLPWLEPYRETMAQERRVGRRSHGGLVAYASSLVLLFAAVGAGGYWLGQRDEAPRAPAASATVALPSPKSRPAEVTAPPPAASQPAIAQAQPEPAKAVTAAPVKKRSAARKRSRAQRIRTASVESAKLSAVRSAQERSAPPPAAKAVNPPWPKMPSPGPAGQVIQLGAFSTPARARNASRARIARYPILAHMPRVIVPVATKPGNRVLYVLRFGTSSRQQSKTLCRNLRRSGDHCLVIG